MTPFTIEINDRSVIDALNRLAAVGRDLTPAMRAIATALLSQTKENFASESGPMGKWPALSRSTIEGRVGRLASKTKGGYRKDGRIISKGVATAASGHKILQDTGHLAASVTPFWSDSEAGIGSNAVYAAIHQFGGKTKPHVILPREKKALAFGGHVVKKVNHPGSLISPRPYLPATASGLQAGMGEQIMEIIQDYLQGSRGA